MASNGDEEGVASRLCYIFPPDHRLSDVIPEHARSIKHFPCPSLREPPLETQVCTTNPSPEPTRGPYS